jgi:hypothetical protein
MAPFPNIPQDIVHTDLRAYYDDINTHISIPSLKNPTRMGFIMSFERKACATLSMQAWQIIACGYPCGSAREGKEQEREIQKGRADFKMKYRGFNVFSF